MYHPPSPDAAVFEDTGHFAILVDDHEVGEVPGDALRNDPLQGQTSSVVHVGVWDYCGQLLAKPHRSLQDMDQKTISVLNGQCLTGIHTVPKPASFYYLMRYAKLQTLYLCVKQTVNYS